LRRRRIRPPLLRLPAPAHKKASPRHQTCLVRRLHPPPRETRRRHLPNLKKTRLLSELPKASLPSPSQRDEICVPAQTRTVCSNSSGQSTTPVQMRRTESEMQMHKPMAIPMRSRQSSNSGHSSDAREESHEDVTNPTWEHEAVLYVNLLYS
jgi:hypothetical protein